MIGIGLGLENLEPFDTWGSIQILNQVLKLLFILPTGHKTEFGPSENERNSYPDPAFLEDVARQLARLGISTENTDDDEETTNV